MGETQLKAELSVELYAHHGLSPADRPSSILGGLPELGPPSCSAFLSSATVDSLHEVELCVEISMLDDKRSSAYSPCLTSSCCSLLGGEGELGLPALCSAYRPSL
ncbi:hypothetical protein Dimus_010420 [Dionaea muscipula]